MSRRFGILVLLLATVGLSACGDMDVDLLGELFVLQVFEESDDPDLRRVGEVLTFADERNESYDENNKAYRALGRDDLSMDERLARAEGHYDKAAQLYPNYAGNQAARVVLQTLQAADNPRRAEEAEEAKEELTRAVTKNRRRRGSPLKTECIEWHVKTLLWESRQRFLRFFNLTDRTVDEDHPLYADADRRVQKLYDDHSKRPAPERPPSC